MTKGDIADCPGECLGIHLLRNSFAANDLRKYTNFDHIFKLCKSPIVTLAGLSAMSLLLQHHLATQQLSALQIDTLAKVALLKVWPMWSLGSPAPWQFLLSTSILVCLFSCTIAHFQRPLSLPQHLDRSSAAKRTAHTITGLPQFCPFSSAASVNGVSLKVNSWQKLMVMLAEPQWSQWLDKELSQAVFRPYIWYPWNRE